LWLIETDPINNKQEVFNQKGEYLFINSASKLFLKIKKLEPSGKPPIPRYGHAVCLFKKQYMCVHGGRNDYLMSDTNNFILNDIHLYDISKIEN
jgi:hypothetical protein